MRPISASLYRAYGDPGASCRLTLPGEEDRLQYPAPRKPGVKTQGREPAIESHCSEERAEDEKRPVRAGPEKTPEPYHERAVPRRVAGRGERADETLDPGVLQIEPEKEYPDPPFPD